MIKETRPMIRSSLQVSAHDVHELLGGVSIERIGGASPGPPGAFGRGPELRANPRPSFDRNHEMELGSLG